MKTERTKTLAAVFALGGVWDTIAGLIYIFAIGTGRAIDNPEMHPFYAVFLGSFFLSFAWMQILSSLNIRRYAFSIGCLVFGRLFYVITLFCFMWIDKDFPNTFWFTGIIDLGLAVITPAIGIWAGLRPQEMFLPKIEPDQMVH
ncbi:MAG: hypothetical protein LWX09_05530 [Bacteroidia bacterium]|nr:hypothetical protein [Bacteroidia bacterium]